jgi:hypothetical protein
MKLFRNTHFLRPLATLAGLVFLNLSFFLTELNILDFKKNNKALYETLVLAFNTICEEEKDPLSGESSETESLNKELDVLLSSFENIQSGYVLVIIKNNPSCLHHPCDGTAASIHQPPELSA